MPRPLARGRLRRVMVAALAVGATTVVIYPLRSVAPAATAGVIYLLAVLLVSTYWGLGPGLLTALGSAAAFNWFYIEPIGRFAIADPEHLVSLGVFLGVAVIASTIAGAARAREAEAERRRQEADIAAEMARTLLGGSSLHRALERASTELARALDLPFARIDIGSASAGDGHEAIALDLGTGAGATLVVPGDLEDDAHERLTHRIVPALEALLAAAMERDRLLAEVVETRALRRSDELKTALLRAVSHDLRSPLTAIIAAGDAVRSPTIDSSEREELASLIVGEATRLSRLVEQLLDLSRLQAGGAEPRRDWCSIDEVVASAVEHLDPGDGSLAVRVSMEPGLPFVEADAAQLERVFVNLLDNARRFSGGHPVDVHAAAVGGHLVIRVIDRGPGIDANEVPLVFEPFRQGTGAGAHSGAGLGLAIVKGLVEANGGQVHVESRPGDGSAFVVELPVSEQPARPAEAQRA